MIIQSKLIRAALVCAAKNDVRYYLNGVHITPKYIEATNGHVALRMEHGIRTKKTSSSSLKGRFRRKRKPLNWYSTKKPLPFTGTHSSAGFRSPVSGWLMVGFQTWSVSFRKKWISASVRLSRLNTSVIRRRCLGARGSLFPFSYALPLSMARYAFSSIRLSTPHTVTLSSL